MLLDTSPATVKVKTNITSTASQARNEFKELDEFASEISVTMYAYDAQAKIRFDTLLSSKLIVNNSVYFSNWQSMEKGDTLCMTAVFTKNLYYLKTLFEKLPVTVPYLYNTKEFANTCTQSS